MNERDIQELVGVVHLLAMTIFSITTLVLSIKSRALHGIGWLILSLVCGSITMPFVAYYTGSTEFRYWLIPLSCSALLYAIFLWKLYTKGDLALQIRRLFPFLSRSPLPQSSPISASVLPGKAWLVAAIASSIVSLPIASGLTLDDKYTIVGAEGNLLLFALYLLGMASFGLFLLSCWTTPNSTLNIKKVLFSFSGRIPRSVFWAASLLISAIANTIGLLPQLALAYSRHTGPSLLTILVCILSLSIYITCWWMLLAIYTKRWHDVSRSGWMSLILLLPIAGAIWFIIYQGFLKGSEFENQYGEPTLITRAPS
ncbi:MAG: DUF805 domain-containing protein [Planctomycetaceae bacterium]|nr:DUF805 domain-containing protein [Planctomycetaceae bacterium]